MKTPTCDCLARAFHNKYVNNPHYGEPSEIILNREDRVVVTVGKHGTVRMRNNYCSQCGKPHKAID